VTASGLDFVRRLGYRRRDMVPVIGLTGGIGSGKSTVAEMLARRGAVVIDADRVGHESYRPGSEGFRQVVAAFGNAVVAPDGSIDRRALGAIVFAHPEARARLNAIVHPLIAAEVGRRVAEARAADEPKPVVVEAALLIDAGWRALVDRVWVVTVSPRAAIARVTASRGLSREEVERRLESQMPDAERRRQADLVIENDGTVEELEAKVEAAWRSLG
jgi:dephospho-CoA kinase